MKFNPTTYTPDTEAHRKKVEAAKNHRRLVEYQKKRKYSSLNQFI